MKKLVGALVVLLLTACGSSSDSDNKNNTPPAMSGLLSLSVKAQDELVVNYVVSDAENDQINITYSGIPSWVTPQRNGNELTLTVKPSFFDIAESSFSINLSDGKEQKTYTIRIDVQDNPDKWTQISNTANDFIGQWSLGNVAQLHLYENFTGFYTDKDNEHHRIEWYFYDSGYIEITSTKLNCVEGQCIEYFDLYTIDENENKKRWVIESDEKSVSITASKYQSNHNYKGYYTSPSESISYVTNMTPLNSQYELHLPIIIKNDGISLSWTSLIQAKLSGTLFNQPDIYQANLDFPFYKTIDYTREMLPIKITVDDISILPSTDDVLVIQYKLTKELVDNSIDISEYQNLDEFINKKTLMVFTQTRAELIDIPDITQNKKYFSGFRFKTNIDNHDLSFGGNEIEFTDNSNGIAFFKIAGTEITAQEPFTWELTSTELIINLNSEPYRYNFIKTNRNDINLLTPNNMIYPFTKLSDDISAQDIIGTFKDESSDTLQDYYYSIYSSYTAYLYSLWPNSSPQHIWKYEEDNSITAIEGYTCYSYVYQFCEQELKTRLDNGQINHIIYRNFKAIEKTQDGIIIQMNYRLQQKDNSISYQTLYRWLNIN